MANGPAYSLMNSHSPSATNSSSWRSASRHMNSSFSLRRFGVISRMSSARCAVWFGGSSVGSWSLIGSSSRCSSMSALDVVAVEGHREAGERSGHRVARREGRGVVVDRDRFLVAGHHHDVVVRLAVHRALPAEVLEVRIGIGDQLVVAEEVDRLEVGHTAPLVAAAEPVRRSRRILRSQLKRVSFPLQPGRVPARVPYRSSVNPGSRKTAVSPVSTVTVTAAGTGFSLVGAPPLMRTRTRFPARNR